MKMIIFLFVIISLSSSCDSASSFEVVRIIKNETDHNIEISVFQEGETIETISIRPFESDTAKTICAEERGRVASCDVVWSIDEDSVTLVFNQEKYITYCSTQFGCLINEKNILALNPFGNNKDGYIDNSSKFFTFPVTQEDYDQAKDL